MTAPAPSTLTPRAAAELVLSALRFYSRLPVPVLGFETAPHAMPDFTRLPAVLPIAGVLIALPAAAALAAFGALDLPSLLAATLALAVSIRTTGAFHEDGLADTADGFGGGRTRERKLDIMKDSRIGTFGGAALVVSILARAAALSALLETRGWPAAAAAWLTLGAVTRLVALTPLVLLPPARDEGAAWAAARPTPSSLGVGAVLAVTLAFAGAASGGLAAKATAVALLAALASGLALAALARRHIGGQTGDVAGAAEQTAEITMLAALLVPALQ